MKVCHIADVHWRGLKRHKEYREVFQRLFADIKDKKVDRIVIAGDIVHTKTMGISPELINELTWWFNEFASIAKTIVVLGNHDGLILNKSRLDTITPIIQSINNENIVFIRNTTQWYDDEFNVLWSNFSCFDEENWQSISPNPENINIALFHGAFSRAVTDAEWEIESEYDISMFKNYDFGMFGDIHKFQYLDQEKRFAYPGSTIQQDFSEDIDKGYLLWNIKSKESYSSKRVVIPGSNPFYTIEWQDDPDLTFDKCSSLQKNSRIRISSNKNPTQDDIKKFSNLLKTNIQPEEIVWKISETIGNDNIELGDIKLEKSSLRKDEFHHSALKDYFGNQKFDQEEWDSLNSIVSNVLHSFENYEQSRNLKWSIRNIEWDNTFAYGKGNKIDFSNLEGIVGLFGSNRCGKSSIPGTIMYSLFNETDRGSISNLHVINARKGDCEARVEFELNNALYRVERMSTKYTNAKSTGAITKMNLFLIDEDGNVLEDVSGEQRRDSDKILRSMIGEPYDFLLTSFASQGEMNTFIRNGATDRKKLLNNFLDLGFFDQMHLKLKEESVEIKSFIRSMGGTNYDDVIKKCVETINSLTIEKDSLERTASSLKEKELSLGISLATAKKGSGYSHSDIDSKKKECEKIRLEIEKNDIKISEIENKIDEDKKKLTKISLIKENFPIESLREEVKNLGTLEILEARLSSSLDRENERLKQQSKSISRLSEVPCGDMFPTCKFIRDSHRDKTLIDDQKNKISNLEKELLESRRIITEIKKRSLEEKIEKYEKILREEVSLSSESRALEVEKNSYISKSVELLKKLRDLEEKISEMELNLLDDDVQESILKIENELSSTSLRLKESESGLLRMERTIGSESSSLEKYQKDKLSFSEKSKLWKIYESLIQAYGKNGLPQVILANQLPVINNEIKSILQGVCGFTVSLVSSGNDLEINLDYGDSMRPIEMGSGMEKMMASLAIRVALINVSSLPKSDILIIDEGFGALDETNVEACNRLLVSLKRYFKTIIVISHVDAIKDAVDNIIEISRSGQDSYVWA